MQRKSIYDQVYRIAVDSPHLQRANRRDLLVVLEEGYRDLGDAEQADVCREKPLVFGAYGKGPRPILDGSKCTGDDEGCGIEIGVRRLEARPTATQCIDCKTLNEIREKQFKG